MFIRRIILLIMFLALISTVQAVSDGNYSINASQTGYTTVNDTVTVSGSAVKILVLHPEYNLTIKARDYSTTAFITLFYSYKDGNGTSSTNGTVVYRQLDYGFYTVSVQAEGYYPLQKTIFVSENTENIFDLNRIPSSTTYVTPHYVKFIVQRVNGDRIEGVNVTGYIYGNSTALHSAVTGYDGSIGFELTRTTRYRITFINGTLGINREATLYPIETEYTIYVNNIAGSQFEQFSYNISNADNAITLRWVDSGILNSLNFSIYNTTSKVLAHQLISSNTSGESVFTVLNTSDIYYVYFTANTTQGIIRYNTVFDYRLGTKTGKDAWGWGRFTVPAWVQNAIAVIILYIMAGSFGAMHSGVGSILTGMFALLFWSKGWLNELGAGAAFLGGIVIVSVIYYMRKNQAVKS